MTDKAMEERKGTAGRNAHSEREWYRAKIAEMVAGIDSSGSLEYLYTFIKLFLEKWG